MSTPAASPSSTSEPAASPPVSAVSEQPAATPAAEPAATPAAVEAPAPDIDVPSADLDAPEVPEPAAEIPVPPPPPPATPEPTIPQWATVGDISKALSENKLPPEAAPWVRATLATLKPMEDRVRAAETEYTAAKDRFLKAATDIEGQGAQGAQRMAQNHAKIIDNLETTTTELAEMALTVFDLKHPTYKDLPDNHPVKSFLSKMWTDGTVDRVFTGNTLEKMEQAWTFACFKTGYNESGAKPVAKPTPEAVAATLVNDGSQSIGRQEQTVDDVSVGEILSRHDHML